MDVYAAAGIENTAEKCLLFLSLFRDHFYSSCCYAACWSLWIIIDYRYGNYGGQLESGTAAMEAITALVDGPLCFIVAYCAAHNHSWRHPLPILLCTMQIYGLVWFTLQPIFSETGLQGHFSSDPVRLLLCAIQL